jgi:hypothetical protein
MEAPVVIDAGVPKLEIPACKNCKRVNTEAALMIRKLFSELTPAVTAMHQEEVFNLLDQMKRRV